MRHWRQYLSFCKAFLKQFVPGWLCSPQGRAKDMRNTTYVSCLSILWYHTNQRQSLNPDCTQNTASDGSIQIVADAFLPHPLCCSLRCRCTLKKEMVTWSTYSCMGESRCRIGPSHEAYRGVKDTTMPLCRFIKVFAFPKFRQLKRKQIVWKE